MIFMRQAEYGNLCDYLVTHGALKEKICRIWFRQIAVALIYLHTIDIAHRDIKCENILITSNHNVKLADFGFSRFSVDHKGKHLLSSTFCGSLPYASPELLKGIPYNPKLSDIWALGVVLFVMLNRIFPFKADNLTDLWLTQMNKNYAFKSNVLKSVSPEVVNIVAFMLEPNSHDRISLDDVIKSKWITADPRLHDYSDLEKKAFSQAMDLREELRPQKIKKISKDTLRERTADKSKFESFVEKSYPKIVESEEFIDLEQASSFSDFTEKSESEEVTGSATTTVMKSMSSRGELGELIGEEEITTTASVSEDIEMY